MFRLKQRFFLGGGQHANPQRFGQKEFASRLRGTVFLHPFGRHYACDRETKDRLRGVNRVSARQRDTGLTAGKAPPLGHFTRNIGRQGINRPAKDRDRHNRFAAHRKNIADGVCCRNAAKIKRVIDYRHKEVGGADNTGAITQIVNRRIIAGFITHQQIRVDELRLLAMQDSLQHFRGNFTTATSAVAVLR